MKNVELFKHQADELEATKYMNKVAYYHDMGLGKTFTGAEKMMQLGERLNLVICQKSKVKDWVQHFNEYYSEHPYMTDVFDLTSKKEFERFINIASKWEKYMIMVDERTGEKYLEDNPDPCQYIAVINYELAFRRKELLQLKDFTLMLDESSLIQNEQAKRTKFIMKLQFKNLILLSGTPTSGKYENLLSQLHLLGWLISKDLYWKQYIDFHFEDNQGFPIMIIDGYKNVDRLKAKMREYGCRFLKTEEVFDLPEQLFQEIKIDCTKEYRKFKKSSIIILDDIELVGDTTLTKMLYERQLCGQYNMNKLDALYDLLQSSDDRIIIFYNFNEELRMIEDICIDLDKPISIVNGQTKDLSCYDEYDNSITLIQYQAGAMGLNLQKANKIIYFTPTLSSEQFEQSKKRIHRIGQKSSCFYYMLICKDSIEENIYQTLAMRKDYTDALFEKGE